MRPKEGNPPKKTEGKKCFGCKQFNFKKHGQAKHHNDWHFIKETGHKTNG